MSLHLGAASPVHLLLDISYAGSNDSSMKLVYVAAQQIVGLPPPLPHAADEKPVQ